PARWLGGGGEVPVAREIDFEARAAVAAVDQAAVGGAAMLRVESHRREPFAVVGFPLVGLAVLVAVFFGGHEVVGLEVLDPAHLAVPACRHFDTLDGAGGPGKRPGVLLAILRPREPDLFELLAGPVVLPALDFAVLVGVDI